MDSSAHDTSKTADQVMARPKIIHITLNDLERPVFEGSKKISPTALPEQETLTKSAACTEAKYLKTRSMCQDIIADLRCVQKAYVFQPKHFDRETIREHLKVIVAEYHLLRNDPSRFASSDEYKEFLATMHTLTADTTQVIRAVKARYQLRLKVQNDINKEISLAGNQRHLPHLSPWSQYLAPGAPSLPAARFLPPFETRPPTDVSFPDHRRISRTSVQALPQAATAILGTWALEFQKANDFYHQVPTYIRGVEEDPMMY